MRMKIWTYLLERIAHAGIRIERMQVMQQEQIRDERITTEVLNHSPTRIAAFGSDFRHSIDAARVKFHDRLDKLQRSMTRFRIRRRTNFCDQPVDIWQHVHHLFPTPNIGE